MTQSNQRPGVLVVGLCLLVGALAWPALADEPVSPRALEASLTYFYLDRPVHRIPAMLGALVERRTFEDKSAQAPLTAFFAELFRLEPRRASEWIAELDPSPAVRPLIYALWMAGDGEAARRLGTKQGWPRHELEGFRLPPPDLRKLPITRAAHVDVVWGAFAGSGDLSYVGALLAALTDPATADATDTDAAAVQEALHESLRRNMRQHELVRRYCQDAVSHLEGPARQALEAIIAAFDQGWQPFPTHQGRFSALIGLHQRADFHRLWESQPAESLPRMANEWTVRSGEHVHVEIFVTGMGLGPDLNAEVRYDLAVEGPGETRRVLAEANSLLDRRVPTAYATYRAPQGIALRFDRGDARGRYVLKGRVIDAINGVILEPEARIDLVR